MFCALPLAFLWFTLINHLRVEWSVNPQYGYGWAVPLLCAYLFWKRLRNSDSARRTSARIVFSEDSPDETRSADFQSVVSPISNRQARELSRASHYSHVPNSFFYLILATCALAYALTRLVQEANPEWRLISWALALEVIGITLLLVRFALGARRFAHLTFPIFFFLVAVPWPTGIEAPLIRLLTTANTGCTVDLLGLFSIPAIRHGNIIEISAGMVGVDDACSGIRSFQATLMVALFLGELYALTAKRRTLCVVAGVALAFIFNIVRTFILVSGASVNGTGAVSSWHDSAGITILIGCFLCLWALSVVLKGRLSKAAAVEMNPSYRSGPAPRGSEATLRMRPVSKCALLLLGWFLAVEAGTELWYRSHEWGVPKATVWHLVLPRQASNLRELAFSDNVKQLLRYDEGLIGSWQTADGTHWQAIFLRWNPGSIAVHTAKSHTPEVCLTAAGRKLGPRPELRVIPVHGVALPFLSYVTNDEMGPLHVFYCLWEDRAGTQTFGTTELSYANRLAPVLAGHRNCGQRSLEIAVAGINDPIESQAALVRELERLIELTAPR